MAVISETSICGSTVRIHDDFMPATKEEADKAIQRVSEVVGAAEMRVACFRLEESRKERQAV